MVQHTNEEIQKYAQEHVMVENHSQHQKGRGAQADTLKDNGSARNGEDLEVCTATGDGRETFAASKGRVSQAENAN